MKSTVLNIRNLSISYINDKVIESFSLSIGAGEIVVLAGPNGCGKSTLLHAVLNRCGDNNRLSDPHTVSITGSITLPAGAVVCHLPQQVTARFLEGTADLQGTHPAVNRLLTDFGLPQSIVDQKVISDGQRQKLALAKALVTPADLLLLDEPTNYLDIVGLDTLEQCLLLRARKRQATLVVTHDRALANNIADRTVMITPNGTYQTRGGFDAAWSLTTSDYEARKKRATVMRRQIQNLQQDYQQRHAWSDSKEAQKRGAGSEKPFIAKRAKKMMTRAKAVGKRIERDMEQMKQAKPFVPKKVNLKFPEYQVRPRTAFSMESVFFSYSPDLYDRSWLLQDICLQATTADKVCLMGANGSGKTTLLKLITTALEPTRGRSNRHPTMNLRYLPQGLLGFFDRPTLLENFADCGDQTEARQYLGAALLRKDKVIKPISSFSPGELMRAAVVKCILQKAEFLLLDEPTSHLDIESIEVLERLLGNFQGGFLAISHDRRFVENVADRLLIIEDGHLRSI